MTHKKGSIITIAEVFPRSERSKPYIRLHSLGFLHWQDEPLEHLVLKANGACIWENWIAVRNKYYTFKGHRQNLTDSKSWHRGKNLKEAWVRPTWRTSQRGRRELGLPLGT